MPPQQIEFAKLYLTNVVTGKRYIKKLVEEGIVDGWDDPRLVSIAALQPPRLYAGIHQDVCGSVRRVQEHSLLWTMRCWSTASARI